MLRGGRPAPVLRAKAHACGIWPPSSGIPA
jgi:hypothetical protein